MVFSLIGRLLRGNKRRAAPAPVVPTRPRAPGPVGRHGGTYGARAYPQRTVNGQPATTPSYSTRSRDDDDSYLFAGAGYALAEAAAQNAIDDAPAFVGEGGTFGGGGASASWTDDDASRSDDRCDVADTRTDDTPSYDSSSDSGCDSGGDSGGGGD